MSEVLTADMETVVQATQWLVDSPETHTGGYTYGQHVVEEAATTDDGSRISPQGVYFGRTETYYGDGRLQMTACIKLVNHADPSSDYDYVPTTYAPQEDDQPLRDGARTEAIDVRHLRKFSDERLSRMAANARIVLAHYGVELGE